MGFYCFYGAEKVLKKSWILILSFEWEPCLILMRHCLHLKRGDLIVRQYCSMSRSEQCMYCRLSWIEKNSLSFDWHKFWPKLLKVKPDSCKFLKHTRKGNCWVGNYTLIGNIASFVFNITVNFIAVLTNFLFSTLTLTWQQWWPHSTPLAGRAIKPQRQGHIGGPIARPWGGRGRYVCMYAWCVGREGGEERALYCT